jgi:hypothetical protein
MEFSMVREIPEIYIEAVEDDSSTRKDAVESGNFVRLDVSNQDLIDAFARFVKSSKGSFDTLLKKWVEFRREASLPVDFTQPESKHVSLNLKMALIATFNQIRKKKT